MKEKCLRCDGDKRGARSPIGYIYPCPECNSTEYKLDGADGTLCENETHEFKGFKCPYCQKRFETAEELEKHFEENADCRVYAFMCKGSVGLSIRFAVGV